MTPVVSVRGVYGLESPVMCIYVGRAFRGRYKHTHELANPFRLARHASEAVRHACLYQYRTWLEVHPEGELMLARLAARVHATGFPLGCWCGAWDGASADKPLCHAVVLSELIEPYLAELRADS